MPTTAAIASTAVLAFLAWAAISLFRNRSKAVASGLSYYYSPIADSKTWYIIIGTKPVAWLIGKLPRNVASFVNFTSYLTRWHSKYTIHEKFGDVTLMVSSGGLSLYVADAAVAEEILANRTKFLKPSDDFEHLKIFGNNVVACNETDWRHHRRFTGPPFNEKNNALVWQETIAQASDMLGQWESRVRDPSARGYTAPKADSNRFLETSRVDFRQLALHVIAGAGFGVHLPYTSDSKSAKVGDTHTLFQDGTPQEGYSRTFRDALEYMSLNLIHIVAAVKITPNFLLRFQAFRNHLDVIRDIENYLTALIRIARAESGSPSRNEGRGGNLLSSIVTLGGQDSVAEKTDGDKAEFLTDREIMGNVFIFSIAGHETTASTLQFAFIMLALNEDRQDWLLSKLDAELDGLEPDQWTYGSMFERLVSLRCLMHEILRLFPPIPGLAKWAPQRQTLNVHGREHQLPEKLWTTINCTGLHYNPKYWGPDCKRFDPSRWDAANESSFLRSVQTPGAHNLEAPGLYKPVPGSWVPFAAGQRKCLGRKFAEVEFAACMAVVLRKHRVKLALKAGETMAQARARVEAVLERSTGLTALVMQEDVGLVLLDR